MRTHLMFRRALGAGALAAATLMIGCIDSNDEIVAPGPPGSGNPQGVVTEIRVTPTEFKAGERIEIAVTSRNTTELPVTLYFTSGCLQSFVVKNDKGVVVAPLGIVCTAEAPSVTLQAGESIDQTFHWDGRSIFGYGPVLPAGDYQIIGNLNAADNATAAPVAVKLLP